MLATLTGLSLALAVILPAGGSTVHQEQTLSPPPTTSESSSCAAPLDYVELLEIVRQAIRVTGGDPSNLENEYRISVQPQDCDYLVIGIRQPETIPQEFAITISRSGEVKSWPWCCVPEFKVGPTTPRKFISGEIPLPPEALDPLVASFPDGQVQLSFVANVEYPDSRIRDFYADWAAEHGWTKVSSDEEPWSVDEWQSFKDMYGSSIDQYLVHWRTPDGSESLRLALRHINDQTRQEVYVIRSPFQLLIPDPADAYAADATEDSPCPHGEFEEPVARHEPLPPGGLLQDRCPEPLIDPNLYISVNSDGKVESIDLLRSSGCDHADEELRRCLSHWRFAPATCDGQPIFVHRSLVVGWDDERPPPSDPHRCRPFEEADELPP